MSVAVLIHDIAGASDAQRGFLREAAGLLREAVATPGFGSSVRQAAFGDTSWRSRHGTEKQLDAEEIWDRIATGRECGHTGDHALNLQIQIVDLPEEKPKLGATTSCETPIRIAGWFVDYCFEVGDRVNLAALLMQQWMLVSGFVHSDEKPAIDDAPMTLARLVRRALEKDHGGEIDARATALLFGA